MTVREELLRLIALNYAEKWVPSHIAYQQINNHGDSFIPGLIDCLSDSESEVRLMAVEMLDESRSEQAIPALVTVLGDQDKDIQVAVAETLGSFGPLAAQALPQLDGLFHGQHGYAKIVVAVAILQIDSSRRSDLFPLIQNALVDGDMMVRAAAEEYFTGV